MGDETVARDSDHNDNTYALTKPNKQGNLGKVTPSP